MIRRTEQAAPRSDGTTSATPAPRAARRPADPPPAAVATATPARARADALVAPARAARATSNKIHSITTQAQFEAMFTKSSSVTAGSPMSLKFLVDRKTNEIFFVPKEWPFHFKFAHDVLDGSLTPGRFDEIAYNRPDRKYIAGSVTRYDSFVDPVTGEKGKVCFSLWPTDRFDSKVLTEAHAALKKGLAFLPADKSISFRPGGPIQDRQYRHD